MLLLKKFFETENSVISSHEYRQFLIEYALIGLDEHNVKKPVLQKAREQYKMMADDYIKFLEKYPDHPVTFDFMQALVDYQTGTMYSFKPKDEVTEEQLREMFIEKYNDPNSTELTVKFVKSAFPSHKTKLTRAAYSKFLLSHLTEGYKGSKITKKDMNAIVLDYQATIEKYLETSSKSQEKNSTEYELVDAINDVVFSKLINFMYDGQNEKYTKEYFLKHYDSPNSEDKDAILVKKYFPTKKSVIDRATYFELILNYLTIGMSRKDSKSAKKKLEKTQKKLKKEVVNYFKEKEKGKDQKQKFDFNDVLEDLISGDLLTFTHSELIPEYQAHYAHNSDPKYLPYYQDTQYSYGYQDSDHLDVDL